MKIGFEINANTKAVKDTLNDLITVSLEDNEENRSKFLYDAIKLITNCKICLYFGKKIKNKKNSS